MAQVLGSGCRVHIAQGIPSKAFTVLFLLSGLTSISISYRQMSFWDSLTVPSPLSLIPPVSLSPTTCVPLCSLLRWPLCSPAYQMQHTSVQHGLLHGLSQSSHLMLALGWTGSRVVLLLVTGPSFGSESANGPRSMVQSADHHFFHY